MSRLMIGNVFFADLEGIDDRTKARYLDRKLWDWTYRMFKNPFHGDEHEQILVFVHNVRRSDVLNWEIWQLIGKFYYSDGLKWAWLESMIE